ncbi:SRPBCC domain-containing protein [Candidatus Bathyarchaeota archaeon]|nr:SRPBCC domain-containing protein [Candidatus Bathyarchaeota archaeon]
MDKIIYKSISLKCSAQKAFQMFTVNHHLEKWLTQLADVEPKTGGKYELFWNPEEKEDDSTIDCKVLVIESGKFLAFEWKGPKQYKHFMNNTKPLTHVIVSFIPSAEGTEVHLLHTGWHDSAEWEEARQWFDKSWTNALEELLKYANKV